MLHKIENEQTKSGEYKLYESKHYTVAIHPKRIAKAPMFHLNITRKKPLRKVFLIIHLPFFSIERWYFLTQVTIWNIEIIHSW